MVGLELVSFTRALHLGLTRIQRATESLPRESMLLGGRAKHGDTVDGQHPAPPKKQWNAGRMIPL